MKKRILMICMCFVLVFTVTARDIKEVKAVAVVDDFAIILAVLAIGGLSYIAIRNFTNEQGDVDVPQDVIDQLNWGMNEAYLQGLKNQGYIDEEGNWLGTGSGNGDNNEPPSNWDKFKAWVKGHGGVIDLSASVSIALVLKDAVSKFKDIVNGNKYASMHGLPSLSLKTGMEVSDYMLKYQSPYYYVCDLRGYSSYHEENNYVYLLLSDRPIYLYWHDKGYVSYLAFGSMHQVSCYDYSDSVSSFERPFVDDPDSFSLSVRVSDKIEHYSNCKIYDNKDDALNAYLLQESNYVYVQPDNVDNSTEIPKLDSDSIEVPSLDEIKEYIKDLNDASSDNDKQIVVDNFVNTITNPQPDTVPDTGNDTGNKDDDTTEPTEDKDIGNFTADLTTLFPFCLPFDLIDLVKTLSAKPVAPKWEIPIKIKYGNVVNYKETFTIDMGEFDDVVKIFRTLETLGFIVGLIMITRNQMIKG